ncbi:MAG: energy transducer TonB [Gemmatimonadales bacterium]
MTVWRSVLASAVALAAAGCGESAPPPEQTGGRALSAAPPDQEPPVAVNPDSPIQYPPRLYDQKVEGDVVLRLYTDSTGQLIPESSKVAESSGYPALDSAALAGARKLRFAPARRRGVPAATAFLQPIEFRHPRAGDAVIRGRPDTVRAAPTNAPAPAPAPARRDTFPRILLPDTSRARPETTTARPDPTPAQPDSAAKADTSAVAP